MEIKLEDIKTIGCDLKCPNCHSYIDMVMGDYEWTDNNHIILYYDCNKCGSMFDVRCKVEAVIQAH